MSASRPVSAAHAKSSPTEPSGEAVSADREARLAELLDRLADQLRRGEQPDIDQALAQNADLADELRPLWAAMLVTDCVAAGASRFVEDEGIALVRCRLRCSARRLGGSLALPGPAGRGRSRRRHARAFAARRTRIGEPDGRSFFSAAALLWRLRARGGTGPRRDGRGLQGAAGEPESHRGLEGRVARRHGEPCRSGPFPHRGRGRARLDHPAIVPVYEVGEYDGQPYFTMKYVEGTTLARRLAEGPMQPREAASLLAPVARAVHFAHTHGVLHRDLKPSNILIDNEGRPHVSDFGLAKRVEADSNLTLTGAILGTPAHMAPEQAAGTRGKLGPASDVYSLGTILYQMLTGRPPFQAASPVDTVLLVLEQDPLPPRLVNPRADRELEMIALKCLQKPQDLRYASAKCWPTTSMRFWPTSRPWPDRAFSARSSPGPFARRIMPRCWRTGACCGCGTAWRYW